MHPDFFGIVAKPKAIIARDAKATPKKVGSWALTVVATSANGSILCDMERSAVGSTTSQKLKATGESVKHLSQASLDRKPYETARNSAMAAPDLIDLLPMSCAWKPKVAFPP